VRRSLEVSERRVYRVLQQPRPTQCYRPRAAQVTRRPVERIVALVKRHPRYGYRHI
jgi:hypothetical protein